MAPLPDDHPEKWKYQEHTRAKHKVLHYYTDVWTRIVSNERYKVRLFDCFAGRGDYESSNEVEPISLQTISAEADFPGSPLIMVDAVSKHDDLFRGAECYFLEPDGANRSALRDMLDSVSDVPDNVQYHVSNKPFDEGGIIEVVSDCEAWGGFGFFFIDPFGLKDLDYETVRQITNTSQFDCIITLMTKELIRWGESEDHQETFETLYGTPKWKEELRNLEPKYLETAEAEYYCSRLEEGGVKYTLAYMTTRGNTRELMYDLVLTTNADKGLEAMKESVSRCGTDYALAYAPKRADVGGPEQATITSGEVMTEEKRAKSYLLSRFAGQKIKFGDLIQKVFADPERLYATPVKKDYRQYLREMDNDGEINILERDGEGDPFADDCTINFPQLEVT
jgi:three-Cys-motif partner protein